MKRCLLLLAALATISPTFALPTGEFQLAPRPVAAAPYDRRNLKVAANDNFGLAVWEDFRIDPNQPPRIWAQRFRRNENGVLDGTGLLIAALPATPGSALRAVASDGNDFLIAWTETDRLKFARVIGETGQIVPVQDPGVAASDVSISFVGQLYALAYMQPASGSNLPTAIEVLMLYKDATVARRAGVVVQSNGIAGMSTALSSNTQFLFVGWSDVADGAVHIAPFLTSLLEGGTVLPAPPLINNPSPAPPVMLDIASDGVNIMATWFDTTVVPPVFRVRRYDGNGVALGPVATVGEAQAVPAAPAIVWDGAQYVVFFQTVDRALGGVRYAANGTRSDVTPLLVAPPNVAGVDAAVSPSIGGSVIAWLAASATGSQVSADIMDPSGSLHFYPGNLSLSTSFVDRSQATVVWSGNHYLGAWQEISNVTRGVVGRFSVDGVPLDGFGISISGSNSGVPVLASNGHTAVVAWVDFGGVAASFIDELGSIQRRMFDFPGGTPTVNWNGTQYVVMWRSTQGQLMALRMTAAGALIDQAPVAIMPFAGQPFVAWTGNSYVVISKEQIGFPSIPFPTSLSAQFVSSSLSPIGTAIAVTDSTDGAPSLADGPIGALVVWPRTVNGTTTLRGARFVNGALLDAFNGFAIGNAKQASVYASAAGWGVVSGPSLWLVSPSASVISRPNQFPFVPAGAPSMVVIGGPEPLVVYRRNPVGNEQFAPVVGHYFFTPKRERSVHH